MKVLIVRGPGQEFEMMMDRTLAAYVDVQSDDEVEADQRHFEAAVARELAGDLDH